MAIHSTGVTAHSGVPAGIIELAASIIVSAVIDPNLKSQHYAGEFLAADNMERLAADVSQYPYMFYDLEVIEEIEPDTTISAPMDMFRLIYYFAVSNRYDESLQWKASYIMAWNARAAITGQEFQAVDGIHGNGTFDAVGIEREFNIPGISVHTLRVDATIIHDVDGTLV